MILELAVSDRFILNYEVGMDGLLIQLKRMVGSQWRHALYLLSVSLLHNARDPSLQVLVQRIGTALRSKLFKQAALLLLNRFPDPANPSGSCVVEDECAIIVHLLVEV